MEIIKSLETFSLQESEHLFLPNSRLNSQTVNHINTTLKSFKKTQPLLFLQTSGTTQNSELVKLVGLSKKSLLTSAAAVNRHLGVLAEDRWLNTLPLFHVGGIGVYFRSMQTGGDFYDISNLKWNPHVFHQSIIEKQIAFTSLVPTQIYDLVVNQLKGPKFLKGVIVGGGALEEDLRLKAVNLGWPLLLSYGLSECCSQVATSNRSDGFSTSRPGLKILPHVQLKTTLEGKLLISSEALFTGYLLFQPDGSFQWVDPKVNGWFQTEDLVEIDGQTLWFKSRGDDQIKIAGELVSVEKVLSHWRNKINNLYSDLPINSANWILFSERDSRKENRLVICAQPQEAELLNSIKADIEMSLLPFERVAQIHSIESLPKSELGKILIGQLRKNDIES